MWDGLLAVPFLILSTRYLRSFHSLYGPKAS